MFAGVAFGTVTVVYEDTKDESTKEIQITPFRIESKYSDKRHPDKITFDLSYKEDEKTIRDLMDDYLDLQPWGEFAINLGLGTQIDNEATAEEYMFLPDYVFVAFEKAVIDRDSVNAPLVSKMVNAFVPKKEDTKNGFFTPLNTFIILFFVVGFVTNRNFKTGKRNRLIKFMMFFFLQRFK